MTAEREKNFDMTIAIIVEPVVLLQPMPTLQSRIFAAFKPFQSMVKLFFQ